MLAVVGKQSWKDQLRNVVWVCVLFVDTRLFKVVTPDLSHTPYLLVYVEKRYPGYKDSVIIKLERADG